MTSTPHDTTVSRWRERFARSYPKAYLIAHGVAGALATIVLLWLFLAIADEIPEVSTLVRVDGAVARWLEAHGTELGETIFSVVSALGAPVLIALIAIALLYFAWRRDWPTAIALAAASGGGVLLSNVLKLVFHRGRPETATEFITRHTWSFPSGHAMNSTIGYGMLTVLLLGHVTNRRARIAIMINAATLIGVIGFSRLYLGVHYLSDVVGGWLAGTAWLLVCVTGYWFAERRVVGERTESHTASAGLW